MVRKTDGKKKADKPTPPTKGLSFMVGLVLFGLILCPGAVFVFYNLGMNKRLELMMLPTLTLACLTGLVIAVIPAIIFMQWTMKRIKY